MAGQWGRGWLRELVRCGLVGAALAVLVAGASRAQEAPAPERVLLLVGDSITRDVGAPGGGFAERLQLPGVRIVNLGCPGASLRDWVEPVRPGSGPCAVRGAADRLDAWRGRADAVHVLLGSNDSYAFAEASVTPPARFGALLGQLIESLAAPVVVSVPPPNAQSVPVLLEYRRQILAVVAAHPRARLGGDFLLEMPLGQLRDGAHPGAEGHAYMAERLAPLLRAALAEPGS